MGVTTPGVTQSVVAVDGIPAGNPLADTDDINVVWVLPGHVWEVGGVASSTITDSVNVPPPNGSIPVIPRFGPSPEVRQNITPPGKF